jgi:DNA primase
MTHPEIKQIKIRDFLASRGINPIKNYGYYGMYHCPFRNDRNASFKVDYRKNLWNDFGTGEGGSIIDLVMKMNGCTFSDAVRMLDRRTDVCTYKHHNVETSQQSNDTNFSFHRKSILEENPSNRLLKAIPIAHPKLIEYVAERKISLDLANRYCREVHYQNSAGKFFSVGFLNDNGGYELNNKSNFKGCIAPKAITTFRNNSDARLVFEGFWDFLSYLTIQKIEQTRHYVAVLNSVANVQKSLEFLKNHKEINTYLDNDEGGKNATALIKANCILVNNRSSKFAGFKDLNDYLCGKKKTLDKPKKRSLKL